MSPLLQACFLFFVCLTYSSFFAIRTACAAVQACLSHWLYAFLPRVSLTGSRFGPSVLQRFLCVMLIVVMSGQSVLASPQIAFSVFNTVSPAAINSGQNVYFWWHSSGWAAWSERYVRKHFPFLHSSKQHERNWDGTGAPAQSMPEPMPQETQDERNARVVRLEIHPKEISVRPDEPVIFSAIGFDGNNSPVGGLRFNWSSEEEMSGERVKVMEMGKFAASKKGSYKIRASMNGRAVETKVTVKGDRFAPWEQPIGTRTVSSRDLPPAPRSSSPLPKTKERIAKNALDRLATRFASAGTKVMPAILQAGDIYGWNSSNYMTADDPGKQRGEPAGHTPDGGAGNANFEFATPVLALDGRGLDINLGLSYNSRIWHKANSEITFDIDRDWPAPGWSLGFGKIVSMGLGNGFMMIEADGTRHPYTGTISYSQFFHGCTCKTSDGSFIDYTVADNTPGGSTHAYAYAHFPNGTQILYEAPGANAIYPTWIGDSNGNKILISYRNNQGPQINTITDTLGRVIRFYYDSNNLLVAITGPGFNGTTRTLVRLIYEWKNLVNLGSNYGFAGLTPRVRNNVIPVIKGIYYPGTNTGYWFGESDSYSAYGMLAKVIEQRGMSFSAAPLPADPQQPADPGTITPGTMTRQMVYDYPMVASSLSSEPTYQNMTETWANMDVAPAVTHYLVQENASPRRIEITRPDGVKTVTLSHNAPGQFKDGLIYQDETYSPQATLLGRSFVNWEQGSCPPSGQSPGLYEYCAPRPSRIEITDERGQKTGKEFSYGSHFNQVTETREYGYGYSFGGTNTLLRKTRKEYLNDANYIDFAPSALEGIHIFNLVTVSEVFAGDGVTRLARTEYSYDQFRGAAGLKATPGITTSGYDARYNPHGNPFYVFFKFDNRGNVTTIKRYGNAVTLDEDTAVIEVRHYDITGNVVKIDNSCCEQTTINYTLNTQYAWPESQTRGSETDSSKQNTTSATYDFNTGLVKTGTDANGRVSQNTYYPDSLRPEKEISPTGAYKYHVYDDSQLSVVDQTYEAGEDGSNWSSRNDKFLDGRGRVRIQDAYGKDDVQDRVETIYDQLGRVWKQSRPYRFDEETPQETPQWSIVTYDFLDRAVQTTAPDGTSIVTRQYNQAPDPSGSSGQPGQTIRVTDPWGRQRWARSDALGRMVEVGEPNPDGNGTLATGALFTSYSYDALDRLTQVSQGSQTRTFKYDSLGRMTHQKLAERAGTLNDAGDYVETGTWSDVFSYDKRSNLTQRVDARGVKTIFKYKDEEDIEDPLNRLLAVHYDKSGVPASLAVNIPDASDVSYVYMTTDDKTRLKNVNVASEMGDEEFNYDNEGRLSQVTQTFTGRESYPLVTNYLWDTLNRLKEKTYPMQHGAGDIRKKVEQTFDKASRPDSLKFGGVTFASDPVYNAASQVNELDVGSQIKESYGYDPKTGLLTSQSVDRGTTVMLKLSYIYTLVFDPTNSLAKTGQVVSITDVQNSTRNRAFEYDKVGRLKKVKNKMNDPTWYQTYTYDRWGNRTNVAKTGNAPQIPLDGLASLSYDATNNRMTSAGFAYDPAGNQTRAVINDSGVQHQYRYDEAGRLAQVIDGSGTTVLATYSYGASNQRLMSVESGVTKYFGWDGGRIETEYEGSGTSGLLWKTSYVYLGGRLLATTSGSSGTETRFHHPDRLGTRLVTDASTGEEVTRQLVMPFGTMQPYGAVGGDNSYQSPTKSNPSQKRFTSYDRSDSTGLDYAVNRFYSSQQGRFTQVDPIGMSGASLSNPQSLNMYAYCGNDPINLTDPDGLFFGKLFKWIAKIFKWIAIAAVVAIAVLTVVPAAWAGTVMAKIGIWAAKHQILASLLGLHTPQFAIVNLASTAGATAAGFWILAGVGAVNSFLQAVGSGKKEKLSKGDQEKYDEAREEAQDLSKDCKTFLGNALGKMNLKTDDLVNAIKKQLPFSKNSTINTVTAGVVPSGSTNPVIASVAKLSVKEFFDKTNPAAATGFFQNSTLYDVYFDSGYISSRRIIHEALHSITKLNDADLAVKLGRSSQESLQGSVWINDRLFKWGCGSD